MLLTKGCYWLDAPAERKPAAQCGPEWPSELMSRWTLYRQLTLNCQRVKAPGPSQFQDQNARVPEAMLRGAWTPAASKTNTLS